MAELSNARQIANYAKEVVNVKDFGAVGDGVTDDTAAIQAAINSDAFVIDGQGLTYKVSASISISSNKKIQNMLIDATEYSSASSFDSVFEALGSLGTSYLLTVDANADETASGTEYPTITLSSGDAANFAVGDLVQISANVLWSDNLNVGELAVIKKISGGVLSLEAPLFYSYAVADGAFVRKINTIENVTLSNIKARGPISLNGTHTEYMNFFSAYCAKDVWVENCRVSEFRINTINFRMAYNCHLTGSDVFDCEGGYGVGVYDSSQNVFITGNSFRNTRHGVTVSASNTYGGGIPNNVHVIGNYSVGRVEAIDCHPGADNVIFAENTLRCNTQEDSGHGGVMFQGRNFTCVNNIFNGYTSGAIIIQPFVSTTGLKPNLQINGNKITTTVASATATGIYIQLGAGGTLKGNSFESATVSNNTIVGPISKGIYVYTTNTATGSADNFVIANNVIKQSLVPIHIRAGGSDLGNGTISGNLLNGDGTVGTSYGLILQADAGRTIYGINITGNTFSNLSNGVRFSTTDTYIHINESNNTFNSVTTPYSNVKTLVISGGEITLQGSISQVIRLDTEGAAATDDLDTINGGVVGMQIILSTINSARAVTIKDSTGNLRPSGDFTLASTEYLIAFIFNGTNWLEMWRSTTAP